MREQQYLVRIWDEKGDVVTTDILIGDEIWSFIDEARRERLRISIFRIDLRDLPCLLDWS